MLEVIKRPKQNVIGVEPRSQALIINTNHGKIKLEPKSSEVIRIVYTLKENFSLSDKPGVIAKDSFHDWKYEETDNELILITSKLCLKMNKTTASIRYFDSMGKLLLQEREYESRVLEEYDSYQSIFTTDTKIEVVDTPDGKKEVIKDAPKIFDKKLYRSRLFLKWQDGEALYGLGQHEVGNINLRGSTVYLHQANMKIAIPMVVSSLGYGLLMDTYAPMIFQDQEEASYLYTEADEELDYYFIYGENIDGVVRGYRFLTGKAVMLPKWAFGFIQSQERYESAQELEKTVDEFRRRQIGLDAIVLDWCSWEGNLWGQKTLDEKRFPEPATMLSNLHHNNAKLMISIWPNMSHDCENYKEFKELGLLLPGSNIYNPFVSEGRELYWKQAKEGLFDYGIDAWWCDSSEPFTPEWNHMGEPEASTMYHEYCNTASKHIPTELMNSFGLYHSKAIYEAQRKDTQDKRVVNLTRSGYTGSQRYGVILWSGDISASWGTLRQQIVAGLNLCVSGLPYWTLDIGAFFVKRGIQWFWNGNYENGLEDLGYRELFTRWYQYGAFLPIFRSHGTDVRRELWNFGEPGDMFYDALLKANHLRYKLIPYIYSMASKVWRDDYTIYRMLAFDFSEDEVAREINDQFMFGDSIMVCPVVNPMYYEIGSKPIDSEEKSRKVYLPKGVDWYDFWDNKYYKGGQTIVTDAPIDKIPLFVKAGSILAISQVMNYVDERPDDPIMINVYIGKDAEFELYSDDGDNYNYEDGSYDLNKFIWSEEKQELCAYNKFGQSLELELSSYQISIISNDE